MKMKKIYGTISVCVLTLVLLFSACGGDGTTNGGDDEWGNPPSRLADTWLSVGAPIFTINTDGSGIYTSAQVDSWKVKGSELQLSISGVVSTVTWSLDLNGNRLTLKNPSSGSYATALKTVSPLYKEGYTPPASPGDIDSSLVGTSWKDNTTGDLVTIAFSSNSLTLGGTSGSINNTTFQMWQSLGYHPAWIAKNGKIVIRYQASAQPEPIEVALYTYVLNGNELKLTDITGQQITMIKI